MIISSQKIFQLALICFSVFVFLILGFFHNHQIFFDFYIFYTAGSIFNSGQDVYNQDLFRETLYNIVGNRNFPEAWIHYVYPPQATWLFSFFARFPIETAHKIVLFVNSSLLVLNLLTTSYIVSRYKSLKLIDYCLISSFLLTGFAYENITNSQLGIFISTLLIFTYIYSQNNKNLGAAISLAITSIKPSFFPFFLMYFVIKRQYLTLIYCLFFTVILTVLPLLISGAPIISTLTNWLTAMGSWETTGNPNSPNPLGKFGFHFSMIDLEPLIYRIFNGQTWAAELTLKIIILITLIYCIWLFLKKSESNNSCLLDFGLISAIAMLFVYHRRYDIFLLFPGLLYIYLYSWECNQSRIKKFWTYLLWFVILLITLTDILFTRISFSLTFLQSSYLWKLILPLPWAGVITLVALLWLKTKIVAKSFEKSQMKKFPIIKESKYEQI